MKLICLTLLIISGITDSRSEQYEVVGAAGPVLAVAGEDVILPCSVKPSISVVDMRVEWFRLDLRDSQLVHLYEDHVDKNTDQIQSYRERTELDHQELQRGDASLKLSSVRVSDEGLYKCFIQSRSWFDDATVNVSVEAVGRPPVITVDGFDHSGGLHLQCESGGWNPEPDLEWLNSEGVRLSSGTTEKHRNTDGFSVKHTVTVYERDSKIHCRFKLKHHMLETLIITTSNMFNSWRTSVIMISVFVVLGVIAGILIAVFAHKTKNKHSKLHDEHSQIQNENSELQNEHSKLQNEHSPLQNEQSKLQNEHSKVQNEYSKLQDEYSKLQNEHSKVQNEHSKLQNEHSKLQNEHIQLQNEYSKLQDEYSKLQNEHSKLQDEKRSIQQERDQLLQSLKTIIPKVNVILDADTAHSRLIVSDDGKQVRSGNTQTEGVDRGKYRFDENLGVLGKQGFSSRCFYFEVQVTGQTKWDLGVARESVYRKGSIFLRPERGYWIVGRRDRRYRAGDSSDYSLSLRVDPERIAVFVNYEKGLIFFYDVKSSSHIYTYTDQSFKEKLYPFVSLGYQWNGDSTPLIICDD
ncbi:butyrophilin subfamily 1 member A1-like [Onychostoma macrolepis]|uniref:butyrophilin subfamily 1 member A1-like n=1 Tax=Onychostoma macrolepis TaxID=369639 RepID=UPI0027298A9E|nr:butyrophilin subfamily 1 member A1-like [Onychostoma macrolepis]